MTAADIAVVIPALNREAMITRALASVHAQTRQPAEIIVVDDGSTDRTAAVAAAAGATVVSMPQRSGSGPARNAGIAASTSQWVAFLDSDDEWHPRHLELLLRQAGASVLVTAPALDSSGRVRGNPSRKEARLDPQLLLVPGDAIVTSGTMVRRQSLEQAGLFRPLPRAQDLDLWLRVLEVGTGIASATPTVTYHEHASQASKDGELMRETFVSILDEYAGRRWLTPGVRLGCDAIYAWDKLRSAQSERDWAAAARQMTWFVRHPTTTRAVARLLLRRRQGRTA